MKRETGLFHEQNKARLDDSNPAATAMTPQTMGSKAGHNGDVNLQRLCRFFGFDDNGWWTMGRDIRRE